MGRLLGASYDGHLLVQVEQGGRVDLVRVDGHGSPRPAAVLRCDCDSRTAGSGPSTLQYRWPATRSSSAGNFVMTSQPSAVTTTSSSIRAADQPSDAGQYVSRANMPSSSVSGCSSETSRLKIGFSQMASPTPCPYCNAKAASSLAKPNSSARGQSWTMSAVVAPA